MEDDELRKASRELFDEIDADKSGSISAAELEMLYKKMGLAFTDADIKQLIQEVDTDNSGQIEFDEFIKLLDKINMDHKFQ